MKMEWGKVAWVATYAKYPLFLYLDLQHYHTLIASYYSYKNKIPTPK